MSNKSKTLEDQKAILMENHKRKLSQINAQIKAQEAKKKTQDRKLDTRRKIIVGALAINHSEKNSGSDFSNKINSMVDEYAIRDNDRILFGLDFLTEQQQLDRIKKHAEEKKREHDLSKR